MPAVVETTEVLVIGAGIIGLLTARALSQRGYRVTVVESSQAGGQASSRAAGIIAPALPGSPDPLVHRHRRALTLFPAVVDALERETGLALDYQTPGLLIPAFTPEEAATLQSQAGGEAVWLEEAEVRAAEPAIRPTVSGALRLPGGRLDPARFVRAALLAALRSGVRLYEGVAGRRLHIQGGRCQGLETSAGLIAAEVTVLAAGCGSATLAGCQPPVPIVPIRGQIVQADGRILPVPLRHLLVARTGEAFRYIVPRGDGTLILGTTQERVGFAPGPTLGGLAAILTDLLRWIPALAEAPLVGTWACWRPATPDGRPILGWSAYQGLLYATGHGFDGLTLAPLTAAVVTALIQGESPPIPLTDLAPDRFTTVS